MDRVRDHSEKKPSVTPPPEEDVLRVIDRHHNEGAGESLEAREDPKKPAEKIPAKKPSLSAREDREPEEPTDIMAEAGTEREEKQETTVVPGLAPEKPTETESISTIRELEKDYNATDPAKANEIERHREAA